MSIGLRIRHLRDEKKMSQLTFSSLIGIDNSQLSKIESGKLQPTIQMLLEISSNFNVTIDHLVKGVENISLQKQEAILAIPLYDSYVIAGREHVAELSEAREYLNPGDFFRDATAVYRIYGDSMSPSYYSGSFLPAKMLLNKEKAIPGADYIIHTHDYAVFKRVQKSNDKSSYLLCSINQETWEMGELAGKLIHEPFEVKIDDITSISIVLGCVRRNQMTNTVLHG